MKRAIVSAHQLQVRMHPPVCTCSFAFIAAVLQAHDLLTSLEHANVQQGNQQLWHSHHHDFGYRGTSNSASTVEITTLFWVLEPTSKTFSHTYSRTLQWQRHQATHNTYRYQTVYAEVQCLMMQVQ